jgi:hypothetical protein
MYFFFASRKKYLFLGVFWGKKQDLKREFRRKIAENGVRIGKDEKK